MNKIEKKISLILAIILMFNFIMPSLVFAGVDAVGSGRNITVSAELERGESAQRTIWLSEGNNSTDSMNFTVAESGLYTISLGGRNYRINNSSSNGTLAAATYVDDNGNMNHSELFDTSTRTVSVYLKAGQSYFIQLQDTSDSSTCNLSIKRQDVDESKIREIKSDKEGEEDLGALKYTTYGSSWDNNKKVNYQGAQSVTETEAKITTTASSYKNVQGGQVSALQKVMVWLIIYGVADTFKNIISLFVGAVSIDSLLFNEYAQTKLSFYKENSAGDSNPLFHNSDGTSSQISKVINMYFDAFRGIAYIFYIMILLYVGIRILISATGREKEKYKSLLESWLIGLLILTFFPLVIKYTILLNESLVQLVRDEIRDGKLSGQSGSVFPKVKDVDQAMLETMGENTDSNDLMAVFRSKALEDFDLGYAFIYLFLLKELISFLFVYYKRMITIVFLLILFPFVAMSYVFDKVKDGQAQIFTAWFRELLLNIFTQFFHAILYCAIMFIIIALKTGSDGANIILVMVGLGYLRKGDSLLHAIFPTLLKGGGAGTTKDIADTAKTMVKVEAASRVMKSVQNMGKRVGHAKNKVAGLRDKAYEHRENKNIDNANKRAVRLEAGRKRDAKDPGKLKLNFQKATNGINVIPEEERENLTPEEREKKDLELKREGLNNLNYAKNSKDPEIQKAYKEFMDGLKPEERQRLEKRMAANEAINMLVTKKGRDGVELTEEQLNIQASILYDITQEGPGSELYGDLYKWMDSKEISTGEKEKKYRSKKTGKLVSKEEYEKGLKNGEKFVEVDVDKKQKLTDYFGIKTDEDGNEIVGNGLKGRVLTTNASRQKERLDKVFNEAVITNPDGTKKAGGYTLSEEERKLALGISSDKETDEKIIAQKAENRKKIQAMVSKFGASSTEEEKAEIMEMAQMTLILGAYQKRQAEGKTGISAKAALDISRRMLDISKNNKGAKALMDTMVVGETSTSGKGPDSISVETRTGSSRPLAGRSDIASGSASSGEARTTVSATGTAISSRLEGSRTRGDAKGSRKLDVDSLGVSRGPESPTEGIEESSYSGEIGESVGTERRETAAAPVVEEVVEVSTDDLSEMKLNLGFSIEGLARRAAKEVIKQNDVLSNYDRRKYSAMAVETMRSETTDELALSETFDSELDDLILGERDVDEDGFIDETDLTQEEIKQEHYESRVRQTQQWYADGTLRQSRSAMARATGEAIGATASATVGNMAQAASGVFAASLTAGLQREETGKHVAVTTAAGMGFENAVERGVIGTYGSENKFNKKKERLTTIGMREASGVEKAFNVHRKSSENVDRPKYVERGRASEAQSRINAFNAKLSDAKRDKK